jgi:hypothetical protein
VQAQRRRRPEIQRERRRIEAKAELARFWRGAWVLHVLAAQRSSACPSIAEARRRRELHEIAFDFAADKEDGA